MKKILALIVVGVLAFSFVGCEESEIQPKKVGETTTTVTEKSKDEKKETKIFKVGDVVQLKDLKVTVNKLYAVEGNEFSKPADGNEFLAIDCTIENISKESQVISSVMMFKVVDEAGRQCEYSFEGQTAAKAGQMDGEVAPGRKMTGVYVVEVPKDKKGLELEFDSTFLLGEQMIVKLR